MTREGLKKAWLPLLERLKTLQVSGPEIHTCMQRYDGCKASESSVWRWMEEGALPRAANLRFLERAALELEEKALAAKPHRITEDEEGRILWDNHPCPLRYEAESYKILKAGGDTWEPK